MTSVNAKVESIKYTIVKDQIKTLVKINKNFTEIKEIFKVKHSDDISAILCFYTETFLTLLPQKGEQYLQRIFENFNEKIIAQWLNIVYGPKSNAELENLLKDAEFYNCLLDLKKYNCDTNFETFYLTLRKKFCDLFMEMQNLEGIVEIYQCLLRFEHLSRHSFMFQDALKELWKKCGIENTNVSFEIKEYYLGDDDLLHQHFQELVQNFSTTDNEIIKNLIRNMFKLTTFKIISNGTKQTLKVEGYKIVLSEIYDNLIRHSRNLIKHIEINAKSALVLDRNLHFPGTNLIITSNTVVIIKPVAINLSGKKAIEEFRKKAKNGNLPGEKGANGEDGIAGESSGHFALFAKSVEGLENLKLILNGGNGSSGQDGGDGVDGEDGVGKQFDEVFDSKHTHLTRLKSAGHILTLGALSKILSRKEAMENDDGRVEIKCDSSYYLSIHTLDVYVGSDGKPGGQGGQRGIGGDGGKRGTCILEVDGIENVQKIKVEAKDGNNGRNGFSGSDGRNGIEGWDIALANKTWGSRDEFGKSQNVKLDVKECSSDDEDAICVKEGSIEKYFKVIPRPCARTSLTENQKESQQKIESDRSGKAIAIESETIDIEAVNANYQQQVASENAVVEEEYEVAAEEEVNRILEHWTFDEREEYIPKRQHNTILYPEEKLSSINLNDKNEQQILWNTVTSFSIKQLFSKYSDEILQQKMKKKQLIYKLRKAKINKIGEASKSLSWEELISAKQNIRQYYSLFNRIKKITIKNQSIQFFITEISKAFEEDDSEVIKKFTKEISIFDEKIKKDMTNIAFILFQQSYNKLSDSMKECNCEILFFYIKLHESLQIYNLFLKNLSNDVEEKNLFQAIQNFMTLQKKRDKEVSKFKKVIQDYEKKFEFKFLNFPESDTTLEEKLKIFAKYTGLENLDTVIYFFKELQFICEVFPVIGITFLDSLLLIFDIEGCHVDVITLKYLIDTVLYTCLAYGSFNCYIFPCLLLTAGQEKWINKFFIFNAESFLKSCLKQKEVKQFTEFLRQFEDENLKILITKKLQNLSNEIKISEKELLNLLDAIKSAETLYPYLKNTELKEWTSFMKQINFSTTIKNESWKNLCTTSKKFILFWCHKLIERFDVDCVEDLMEPIIEILQRNENIAGRLIYRMCSDETTIFEITKDTLKSIFGAVLYCLKTDFKVSNEAEAYKIAKELLLPYPNELDSIVERSFEDVKLMCQKINPNYYDYKDMLNLFLHVDNLNVDELVYTIILNKLSLEDCKAEIENGFHKFADKIDKDIFYIELINKVILNKQNFGLRPTQKIAILFALKNYQSLTDQNGILQQIATGEGKTLIIAVVSIISVLKGHTVNIVTSSSVLAKRDAEDPPCVKLFKAFGLKVEHICHENPKLRTEAYSTCHIIYGDLTNYQRDFLTDNYNSTHIASNRKFDIVIADEVDSLLLDNGLNTLYLSHNIGDFEMLHSLIIQIWNLLNLHIKNGGNCKIESFYQKVYSVVFPVLPFENFSDILEISNEEAHDFKNILIEKNIIDKSGEILITSKHNLLIKLKEIQENFDSLKEVFVKVFQQEYFDNIETSMNVDKLSTLAQTSEIEAKSFLNLLQMYEIINLDMQILSDKLINEKLEMLKSGYFEMINNFILKYDAIKENLVVEIPEHLKSYVKIHLKEFIANAEIAYKMEPDIEYQVAMPKITSLKDKIEPTIVIIDRDTGVHLQKTFWHKGLHQFLQLKHGLRLTALSTKAVFISNITFVKKFYCIYGFSGTLGSDAEKEELNKFYGLKSVIIPSSNVKQFYEEPTIIKNSEEKQYKEIFEIVKLKMVEGRSVLIIADSVKQVNLISDNLKILAEQKLSENECKPFKDAILYKRDTDKFEYNDGKTELEQQTFIIATPLASRGTNIKLSKALISNGGLHVIIAFLPKNIRIEEQAFGRAARCGEPGTAQLIIFDKSVKNENSANIKELKFKRDGNEKERIKKMQNIYETKLEVEKECLLKFGPKYLEIVKKEMDNKFAEILSKDLRDSWALFLDQSEYECGDKEETIAATVDFCKNLNIDRNKGPSQPLNILNYAVILIKNEKWKKANILLQKVCSEFPAYLPEAQYYSIFITVKKKEEQKQFQLAQSLLSKARNGFAKRILNYSKLSEIVNQHKVVEENRIFECDTFLQQQKESIKLINRVIESIDDFFGRIITPFSFTTNRICAEASMFLFKRFSSSKHYGKNVPITGLKIKKEIDEKNLKSYCQFNGFRMEDVIKSLNVLENYDNINVKMLQKEMQLSKWEDFWLALKENGCFKDEKEHMFLNTLKVPRLSALKLDGTKLNKKNSFFENALFQHLTVTESHWEELDKEKVMEKIDPELLELLIENEIIVLTKSGIFCRVTNVKFDHFNTVTKNNLAMYGIPESKISVIFEELINQNIFEKISGTDNYQLSANFDTNNFVFFSTSWYGNIVTRLIQQKLPFGLAYHILSQSNDKIINEEILFRLSLIFNQNGEEEFLGELIEHEIIERTNVNLDALNTVTPEANIVRKGWEKFCETESSFNILVALNDAENFIERIFGAENVGFSLKKLKWYQKILPNSDVSVINEIFDEFSAKHQKFSTFDATMIPLKETDLHESETSHLMITHGITHLLKFHEKKWASKTLIKSTAITGAGIAQLVGGVSVGMGGGLTGVGAVPGAVAAKVLLFEGINDILFGVKGFATGFSDNYVKHKLIGLGMNVTFCGAAEGFKFLKFASEFSLAKTFLNKTNAGVNAGANLSKQAFIWAAPALFNIKKAEEKCVQAEKATNFAVEETFKEITLNIDKIFETNEDFKLLQKVMQHILKMEENFIFDYDEMFEQFITPILFEISYFLVEQLRNSIIEKNEADKGKSFKTKIKQILKSSDFGKYMEKFNENIYNFVKQLEKTLNKNLLKLKSNNVLEDIQLLTETDSANVDAKTKEMIKIGMSELKEKIKQALKEGIKVPLNYDIEEEYNQQLNFIVKSAYSELRNSAKIREDFKDIGFQNEKDDATILYNKVLFNEFKKDFFENLEQIRRNDIVDMELYAAVVLELLKINDFEANVLSQLLSEKLSKHVIIKNTNNAKSDESDEKRHIVIAIHPKQDSIDSNEMVMDKNVYDQIFEQLPQFTHFFEDKATFLQKLSLEFDKHYSASLDLEGMIEEEIFHDCI